MGSPAFQRTGPLNSGNRRKSKGGPLPLFSFIAVVLMSVWEIAKSSFRTLPYWSYIGIFFVIVFFPFSIFNLVYMVLINVMIGISNFLIFLVNSIVNVLLIGIFGIFNLLIGFLNTILINPINTILGVLNTWSFTAFPGWAGYTYHFNPPGETFDIDFVIPGIPPVVINSPFNFSLLTPFSTLSTTAVNLSSWQLSYITSGPIPTPPNNLIGLLFPGVFPV